ncbi:MAG: hypothetical protein ACR2IV_24290 [Bryobacteraceae bacterium]
MAIKESKRIYRATGTFLQLDIKGPAGVIGRLTIEPSALNALTWLPKGKHEGSEKRKTLLNLVKWMES